MMCAYGNCTNDTKETARRVRLTVRSNKSNEVTESKEFCSLIHARLWCDQEIDRLYSREIVKEHEE